MPSSGAHGRATGSTGLDWALCDCGNIFGWLVRKNRLTRVRYLSVSKLRKSSADALLAALSSVKSSLVSSSTECETAESSWLLAQADVGSAAATGWTLSPPYLETVPVTRPLRAYPRTAVDTGADMTGSERAAPVNGDGDGTVAPEGRAGNGCKSPDNRDGDDVLNVILGEVCSKRREGNTTRSTGLTIFHNYSVAASGTAVAPKVVVVARSASDILGLQRSAQCMRQQYSSVCPSSQYQRPPLRWAPLSA
ncbi:uncharacterized protein PITG_07547 [Phytophthora infestans T30-4]|uniref:Uncharacterized protein n=1 Tax=Phytophthora infestans (strain T30-4) TaxID=403677 RepID=D0N8L7_PHYIT|nr:uncharacterized protein PITG_07547 [Phytophthora infestans T30-4]EEY53902.1 hypothetical protein PITG_07547 [Phytophthora infestans T30-4]|eukprot:XP_002904533.1 hypothetical protein PITG_07547 [Phytophthora infestans T30-4]